jgi:oligopeptide/dipeptide ABC transporter ATP-binding protein
VNDSLLSVENLHVRFNTYAGQVHAVNGMSFDVRRREIFGLVGESGCGKSVTGLAIVNMIPSGGRVVAGRILLHERNVLQMSKSELQQMRGSQIAMIFQDPTNSLNPVFTVGDQTVRIIRQHMPLSEPQARRRALEMFEAVALPDPERTFRSYPHQLSGGMQQRVMIGMALSCGAGLLIADEPTTALDVTIQAQILALLTDLRREQEISILLISHNLGVVAETCDRVGVAYAGRIVEIGRTEEVLFNTRHPYTQGLLAALPSPASRKTALQSIPGSVPDGLTALRGCPFYPRCPHAMDICLQADPQLIPVGGTGSDHRAACYLYSEEDSA